MSSCQLHESKLANRRTTRARQPGESRFRETSRSCARSAARQCRTPAVCGDRWRRSSCGCIRPDRQPRRRRNRCAAIRRGRAQNTGTPNRSTGNRPGSVTLQPHAATRHLRSEPGRRVGNIGETVANLVKRYTRCGRLTGHVLVAVEHDLRSEQRTPRHLDRHVPPLGVDDVKRKVISASPSSCQRRHHTRNPPGLCPSGKNTCCPESSGCLGEEACLVDAFTDMNIDDVQGLSYELWRGKLASGKNRTQQSVAHLVFTQAHASSAFESS